MSKSKTTRLPSRVFLWTIPRAGSTAFYKSVTANGKIKGYFEPFSTADHHGPDGRMMRIHKEKGHGLILAPEYAINAVKSWLNSEQSSESDVFVKDFPYAITDRFHLIPEGYRHSFLIRKPESVFKSYYRLFHRMDCDAEQYLRYFVPLNDSIFKSMVDVAEYVVHDLKKDIVIIDIDDVMANPAEMIQKYCQGVGFTYDEGFLHWDKGIPVNCPKVLLKMEGEFNWLENVMNSTGWQKGVKKTVGQDEIKEYPQIVWDLIEAAEPYYRMLRNHERCLRLDIEKNNLS